MKIIDCFTYFDKNLILKTKLNSLYDYVDQFVICEAKMGHARNDAKLNFINLISLNFISLFKMEGGILTLSKVRKVYIKNFNRIQSNNLTIINLKILK